MQLETTRFGNVIYGDDDVLTMPDGLVGFPQCRTFLLLIHKEGSAFRWLQCIEEPSAAFLVLAPANFAPDYAPELPATAVDALQLNPETPRIVFSIVSIPPGKPEEMTANLAGPIVINAESRLAAQIVVEDSTWTTQHKVIVPNHAVVQVADSKIAA